MAVLKKILKGHALVLVIGGEYRGSVVDASVISVSDDYDSRAPKRRLVNITTMDRKKANWRKSWAWCKKDIKWISQEKLGDDRLFEDGVMYNVDARVRKAIKKHDGAWIIRLKLGK